MTYKFSQRIVLQTCPYCGISKPQMNALTASTNHANPIDGTTRQWQILNLTCCNSLIIAQGARISTNADYDIIERLIPEPRTAAAELPDQAKKYLAQALITLHAPDAAVMMAGSAVDAMLKAKGFNKGSVYKRIEQAVEAHVLTKEMGEWAHHVRLEANRPRHADGENPHLSATDAEQAVQFAEALGQFLFVLSSRVKRGIEIATSAEPAKSVSEDLNTVYGSTPEDPPPR